MNINYSTIDSTLRQIRDDLLAAATLADATVIQFDVNLAGLPDPGVPEADIERLVALLADGRQSIWTTSFEEGGSLPDAPEQYMAYHLLLDYGEAEQVLGPMRILIPALERTLALHPALRDAHTLDDPSDNPDPVPIVGWVDYMLVLGRMRRHPLLYTTELPLGVDCWGEGMAALKAGNRDEPLDGDDRSFVERLQTMLSKNPSLSVLPGIMRASAYAITWMLEQPAVRKE